MSFNIRALDSFTKQAKRLAKKYKRISEDLTDLQAILTDDPKAGTALSHNCFKIRLQNSSTKTGKSGGFRIIYYYLSPKTDIYLLSIYSKTEQSNIDEAKIIDLLMEAGLAEF